MKFNEHSNLKGEHAFLGPSKYHWINYDQEKIISSYDNYAAIKRGTELHEFASQCIKLGQKLPNTKKTLNMYVNDAIGFKMTPEQMLYYSENCFGTADTISFRKKFLRIHDYKSGKVPGHIEQLLVYTSLFCLEYGLKPGNIGIELRIYQYDNVLYHKPTIEEIVPIMDKIVHFDKIIDKLKSEEN